MERIKEEFNRYKWVLLAGLITAILIGLITANLHVVQFMTYKLQGNIPGIINILEDSAKNSSAQSDWYFIQGVEYLLKQNELSQETQDFFDQNFDKFSEEIQLDILTGYNQKKLFLTMTPSLMTNLMTHMDLESVQGYVKRLEPEQLEQGLVTYYGTQPEVNEAFVGELYSLLSIYPKQLPFDKFQFNLYDVLVLEKEETKQITIFSKLAADKASENLFKSLKSEQIEGEQLRTLVEFLKTTKIIDDATYTSFNNMYSEVYLIRNQYKELNDKEIDLKNKKEAVDVQIAQSIKDIEVKKSAISNVQGEINNIESQLGELSNSAYMALYIEKSSGTGANEYEASIPKKGIFGNYKPSNQKYIVKLTETSFLAEGVHYMDLYLKGTKSNKKGNEYPYYVEVSSEELASMSNLQAERNEKVQTKTNLEQELSTLEAEVQRIKDEAGYDVTQEELKSITLERDGLNKRLSEKVVEIKTLFGLGHLTISMEVAESKTNQE